MSECKKHGWAGMHLCPDCLTEKVTSDDKKLPVDELVRVKSLLRLLWITYDAGGISMGRSHEAVLLEAAIELLEDIDNEDISDRGEMVNETRNYLSSQLAMRLNLDKDIHITT